MTAEYIDESIARALRGESCLDPAVLEIHGFATPTMRHLFSNLCHVDGLNYLEVGVFCGATFVAAFNNNPIHAVGIDNFSQLFGQVDARKQFDANVTRWKGTAGHGVMRFDADCFDVARLPFSHHFDIFYYDGEHSFDAQSRALPAFFDALATRFLFIVDDISWTAVSNGTQAGFHALGDRVKIEQQWVLFGQKKQDDEIWHNGMALYLCSKTA